MDSNSFRCQWQGSSVFVIDFEQISRIVLVFALLNLNMQMTAGLYLFRLEVIITQKL